eukprot:TRINITY_DN82622_c0_g1_i1.p1 TRINITY_DN82622_c0_g1~~TRINITY_DN82622_c0_g1_i1.p1  ORF type:complete len:451 (+),score=45.55 TRINITY_DN82622_c0_g1_i1:99-1355(+)
MSTKMPISFSSSQLCPSVLEGLRMPERFRTEANRTQQLVVYRCRKQDDCGGWGDRFAGIVGSAFLAMSLKRSFKIEWPGLDAVLKYDARIYNWSYDEQSTKLWLKDRTILRRGVIKDSSGVFPDKDFPDLSDDAAVLNVLNLDGYPLNPILGNYFRYRILFFHGNRGLSRRWFQAWAKDEKLEDVGIKFVEIFGCIFESLFSPSDAFLNFRVPMYDTPSRPTFGDLLTSVRDRQNSFSIAIHWRVSDRDMKNGQKKQKKHQLDDFFLRCVESTIQTHSGGRPTTLFIFSNSEIVKEDLRAYFMKNRQGATSKIEKVWVPMLQVHSHINENHDSRTKQARESYLERNKTAEAEESTALMQTLVEWFIMKEVSAIVFSKQSGFPLSASLCASPQQIRTSAQSCTAMELSSKSFCHNRFCP